MKRQDTSPLVGAGYALPFALITLLFFLWGFARAILDVLNKHFQNVLDISLTHSTLIQVTTYLCYFLMAVPAGLFINRFGYRRGVLFGLTLFAAGSFLFIPADAVGTFGLFLLALAVLGCGLTFLETAANPYSTELGPHETATSRLNLSQSFNGLGCVLAPLVVGRFLFGEADGSVAVPYTLMGLVVLLVALAFSRVRLPEVAQPSPDDEASRSAFRSIGQLFRRSSFVLGLAALLAYEVAEISINSYFIHFVTGQGWLSLTQASDVLAVALAFFMVGRFVGSWVMRRVRAERALLVCAAGSVACIVVVLADVGFVSCVALILNYVFEAIMFPTIFALSLKGLGSLTKSASSLLMMTPVGGCGYLLMGMMADHTTLVLPFVIPLVGYALVGVFAYKVNRQR
ncbi:MAG: sugar MFS transporter [Bacteroidaceae bacterium]|nr:sugar MFS transporter [Bacteroidaceae bacterium]